MISSVVFDGASSKVSAISLRVLHTLEMSTSAVSKGPASVSWVGRLCSIELLEESSVLVIGSGGFFAALCGEEQPKQHTRVVWSSAYAQNFKAENI